MIPKGDRDYATEVDLRIEEAIRGALPTLPRRSPSSARRGAAGIGQAEAIWVLDPIDGTVNFANGSPLCAISLALVERGSRVSGSSTCR